MAALTASVFRAMKMALQATQLDEQGRDQDAYVLYLQIVQFNTRTLLEEANKSDFGNNSAAERLVKLTKQCVERVEELINRRKSIDVSPKVITPNTVDETNTLQSLESLPAPPTDIPGTNCIITSPIHKPHGYVVDRPISPPDENSGPTTAASSSERSLSPGGACGKSFSHSSVYPNSHQTVSQPSIKTPVSPSDHVVYNKHGMPMETPVDSAIRQNRKLMSVYQSRMGGLSNKQVTDLSLGLQRRLAENIAIAKARQQALERKLKERHSRMQEEAARRFQSTNGMTEEEQERRTVYTKILEYEHDVSQLLTWREKLSSAADEVTVIHQLVCYIFSLSTHPLTQLLYKYQYAVYNKIVPLVHNYSKGGKYPSDQGISEVNHTSVNRRLSGNLESDGCGALTPEGGSVGTESDGTILSSLPCMDAALPSLDRDIELMEQEALQRHLHNITNDVQDYLEKLLAMFIVTYECLDTDTGRDVCYSVIEEAFFKPVWDYMVSLFRLAYHDKEAGLQTFMQTHKGLPPVALGVPRSLCLLEEDWLLMPEGYVPFAAPIAELQHLTVLKSPLAKLESIVKVSRLVCKDVEDFYAKTNKDHAPNIGADDLLPVLCYVLTQSAVPQVVTECHALEEMVHEGYLMGEEGYCLTSLQTAIAFCLRELSSKSIHPPPHSLSSSSPPPEQ